MVLFGRLVSLVHLLGQLEVVDSRCVVGEVRGKLCVHSRAVQAPLRMVILLSSFLADAHAKFGGLLVCCKLEGLLKEGHVISGVPSLDTFALDNVESFVFIHFLKLLRTAGIVGITFLLELLHHLVGLLGVEELEGEVLVEALDGLEEARKLPHL